MDETPRADSREDPWTLDIIKKIFLHTLVKIFFRYHIIFGTPCDPLTNKKKKKENFTYGVLRITMSVRGVHFWRNFWKIFKNEDFGLKFFNKGIFQGFFRHSILNENVVKKFRSRASIYICIYICIIYIYIGGLMEYISQKVAICSIWTVCPCLMFIQAQLWIFFTESY